MEGNRDHLQGAALNLPFLLGRPNIPHLPRPCHRPSRRPGRHPPLGVLPVPVRPHEHHVLHLKPIRAQLK